MFTFTKRKAIVLRIAPVLIQKKRNYDALDGKN